MLNIFNTKARSKKSVFTLFLALFFVLGFWALSAPKAEAYGAECYVDSGVCKYDDYITGNEMVCTLNIGTDPYIGFGLGNTFCTSGSGATQRLCRKNSCSGTSEPGLNGKRCEIRAGVDAISDPRLVNYGVWDYSEDKCIICPGKTEMAVCGNTSGIYVNALDNCTGTNDNKFDSACGASAACDEKAAGDSCAGGTCDSNGNCVASGSIAVTPNPNTITVSSAANIEFTTTNGVTAISGVLVTITGPGINANCTTNASGKCTVTVTATAAGSASVSATKSPLTAGSANITINPALACPGGFLVDFSSGSYSVGDQFLADFSIGNPQSTYGAHSGCVGLYNPSNTNVWEYTDGNGLYGNRPTGINATAGTWKVTIMDGTICDVNSTCFATMTVAASSGCTAGTCNPLDASQYCSGGSWASCPPAQACSAGVCAPVGPPNIHINSCPSCNPVGTGPCQNMLLNDLWTALTAPTTAAMCTADSNISTMCAAETAGGFPGCQIVLSNGFTCNCAGAAPTCSAGDGCVLSCTPPDPDCAAATCAAGDGCLEGCIPADPDCPPPTCGGPNTFRSPINYCDIASFLDAATGWILSLVASIIILIMIIGGLMYIGSAGDEERLRTAKNIILYAVIGLGIILISYALITEVRSVLGG